jgi:ABC-2 type transport system permease protein
MSWSRIYGVFLRYCYVLLKGSYTLTDLFYWPFVDILLWGLTSTWIGTQHNVANLPLVLMTGLIFWQITWRGSADVSTSLVQEFWHRNLANLFSTPLKITEWTLGVILLCLCKLCVSLCFGAFVVYLLYALNIFTVGWLFLPFAVSLLIFGWAIGFTAAAMIIYWGHQVEILAWTLPFVFAPFSAVFYPLSMLPIWAQKIGMVLPTTYVFEGMRRILNNEPFIWTDLGISLVLDIAYLALSIWFFNYMFQKSRRKGLARHA